MHDNPRVMVLIEPSRAYERALLRGIARYAHLHGPWIFSREAPFWERSPHRTLLEQMATVDGIITREGPDLSAILKLGTPAIVSNVDTERIGGVPNIISDHKAIGRMAAEHLIERGFRNFAFCGYGDLFWSDQRCEGFLNRVRKGGGQVHVYGASQTRRRLSWKKELPLVTDWLMSLPKPVGLMACIDERSQQVADACRSAGIAIPEQVAIVGVDNDDMICTLSTLPLSSVATDAEKGGYEAARLLDTLMKGRRSPQKLIEIRPTHVVMRTSTDIMAAEDPHVSKATKYIGNRCRHPLYVDEVARVAGLSRRVLEKRFRAQLDRSVNEHIRRCRVHLIERLLTEGNMTITEIALFMGFPDAAHIARYFRQETGISPAAYRREHHLVNS